MLSIAMITAITVVALPHLRLTTLSIMRSIGLTYVIIAYALVQSSVMGIGGLSLSLFNEAVTVDTIGVALLIMSAVILYSVQAFYSHQTVAVNGTPYAVTLLTMIMLIGAYYLVMSQDIITAVISLEIQSFAVYALTAAYRWREGATSAGLMYFMLGAFSSGLVLLRTYHAVQLRWGYRPRHARRDERALSTGYRGHSPTHSNGWTPL